MIFPIANSYYLNVFSEKIYISRKANISEIPRQLYAVYKDPQTSCIFISGTFLV